MRYSNPKISEKYSDKMRLCVTHMTCKKPPRYFCPVRGGICFFICRVLYWGESLRNHPNACHAGNRTQLLRGFFCNSRFRIKYGIGDGIS